MMYVRKQGQGLASVPEPPSREDTDPVYQSHADLGLEGPRARNNPDTELRSQVNQAMEILATSFLETLVFDAAELRVFFQHARPDHVAAAILDWLDSPAFDIVNESLLENTVQFQESLSEVISELDARADVLKAGRLRKELEAARKEATAYRGYIPEKAVASEPPEAMVASSLPKKRGMTAAEAVNQFLQVTQ